MAEKSLNKVQLIGRLGKKPDLRFSANCVAWATFSMATNEREKKGTDEYEDKTEWHNIVAVGKVAEICSDYLDKGSQVYVEGKLQTRSWDDEKHGIKRYATEVKIHEIIMLGGKGNGGSFNADSPHPSDMPKAPTMTGKAPSNPADDDPFK